MKVWIVLALASTVGSVVAQTVTQGTGGQVQPPPTQSGAPPDPGGPSRVPTQPSGFPPNAPRSGQLPPPEADREQGLRIVRGETTGVANNRFTATNAEVLYRGYQVFADRIEGDLRTNIFVATGNVRLYGQDAAVVGERVEINFDDRTFIAFDADSEFRPGIIGNGVEGDLYFRGGKTYGGQRRVFGEDTAATSCNKEEPHYQLIADRTDVRPGRRVVLRRVKVEVLGRTLLTIPYLSIPIDRPTYRYLPEVGRTEETGYYTKTRWGLNAGATSDLDARFDYYEKLGAGYGADWDYGLRSGSGILRGFLISGPRPSVDLNQEHQQAIGRSTLNVVNQYQRRNFENAPDNTILTSRLTLQMPQRNATTRLNFFRNTNDTSTYSSENQTIGVSDTRTFSPTLKTSLDVNLIRAASRYTTGAPVSRDQLDVRFRGDQDLGRATAQFLYQRQIPVGENANFFSASDLTPAISLRSDAKRLFGEGAERRLPFTTELSLGEFVDPIRRGRITRNAFDFNFNRPDVSQRRFTADFNGRFRQGLYSDDTAQYVLALGTQLSYRLGPDTAATLRYNYLRPYGFSPLQIDRTGRTNLITADLAFRPLRSVIIGAQSGYDLLQLQEGASTAWQSLGIRAEYQPTDWFGFRALTTYDPLVNSWTNVRLDLAYRPGATFVSAGARYDGVRKQWAAANLFVDGLKMGRLRASTILAYNGYQRKFEARHFQFTYDLHCAEAILTVLDNPIGFRPGRTITFYLRLKAFPFDTNFGVGQRGQPIGTGTGIGF